MHSQIIRKKFLEYFEKKQHRLVPSAPVVPHDDPTLLFVNAGMNPFKDVFLGKSMRTYTKATSNQKCIRVGGKHNDLENVGHTSRHLTFFEMLGNFSFGDYFKKEAIAYAWQFSTEELGLDGERIWVSVFREDDEAYEIWKAFLPEERIVRLDEKDNFWMMGDTGPCGPCTELLFDRGKAFGEAKNPYEDISEERFFEFWNLVFMEFHRDATGKMAPLPNRSVDTGMGLERIASLKQGAATLFEIDIFKELIEKIASVTDCRYQKAKAPFHVIADHLRTLAFAIADGAVPSNVDRGYVLRKVLRRAVRYGRQLGMHKPFLAKLLPTLIDVMGGEFAMLKASKERIAEILTIEEEAFFKTLLRGGNLLNQVVEGAGASGTILGDDAFKLKDTYGLPLEEVVLLAKDADLTVDLDRYQELEEEAKERSKRVHKKTSQKIEEGVFAKLVKEKGKSTFLGYEALEGEGVITALFSESSQVDQLSAGQGGSIVLDKTPFYPEKGGQVGDTGFLHGPNGRLVVEDCQSPYTGAIVHLGKVAYGTLKVGDLVKGEVDRERRRKIAANHTATHLLHWALQRVLGEQVGQAGSVVAPERLRFDFNHHKGLTKDEITQIEDLVNEKIRLNCPVETYEISYAKAQQEKDIKQFFGDKYGDRVRVVDMGFSKELCGGTHAECSGNIGTFLISEEGSIAAGVRRIVALTGQEALYHVRTLENLLEETAAFLKTKRPHLLERASQLMEENTTYAQEIRAAKKREIKKLGRELATKSQEKAGLTLVIEEVFVQDLKTLADEIASHVKQGVIVLGVKGEEKAQLVARVCGKVPVEAKPLIQEIAPLIKGGGGGKKDFAQAGGRDPSGIEGALKRAREWITSKMP